jgi:diguanylate cyclase (GGDEF)-like protein
LLRNINNSYGHLAGDIVLQGIAELLQRFSRNYDTVARFGGEEFAILFPETTPEVARRIAEKMRAAIATTEFALGDNQTTIQATMSFGVAGRDCPELSCDDLVHYADLALYQAKENGRNQVVRFSDE